MARKAFLQTAKRLSEELARTVTFLILWKTQGITTAAATRKNHRVSAGFTDYFDYFYKTVQIDNKVFNLVINVKKQYGSNDGYTCTIKLDDNKTMKASPAVASQPSKVQGTPSDTTVTQPSVSVKLNSSRDSATDSKKFKAWFRNSKAVNKDGSPMVLYHQTANDFTVFDPKHPGAGSRDYGTPYGIFMKPDSRDIGVKGSNQMALYASIQNPMIADTRKHLENQNLE